MEWYKRNPGAGNKYFSNNRKWQTETDSPHQSSVCLTVQDRHCRVPWTATEHKLLHIALIITCTLSESHADIHYLVPQSEDCRQSLLVKLRQQVHINADEKTEKAIYVSNRVPPSLILTETPSTQALKKQASFFLFSLFCLVNDKIWYRTF